MTMRFFLPIGLAVALTAIAVFYFVRKAETLSADIAVTQAWARATPPGASVGAVYVTIENRSSAEDKLVGVSSPAAQSATVHETVEEGGVTKMQQGNAIIAPGGTLEMKPGGMHVMLMGLAAPLKEGESVKLTLDFEKAGSVPIEAKIAPIGAAGPMQ